MIDDLDKATQIDDLASQMLQCIEIEGDNDPRRRTLISTILTRLMRSAKARDQAKIFLSEEKRAILRFEAIDGQQGELGSNGVLAGALCGTTSYSDGNIVVTLHETYLTADINWSTSELPAVLCHELFGHGIWLARAAQKNAYQAVHHHDLSEINARITGWISEFELNGRIAREADAQRYLADSQAYVADLKLLNSYYAMTFSSAEMMVPEKTLTLRLDLARKKRDGIERNLQNNRSWIPTIDHFVQHHDIAEGAFMTLRGQIMSADRYFQEQLKCIDEVVTCVQETLTRFESETDAASARYLKWAANCPLVMELRDAVNTGEAELRAALLKESLESNAATSIPAIQRESSDSKGQITFEALKAMYDRDRSLNPQHWQIDQMTTSAIDSERRR